MWQDVSCKLFSTVASNAHIVESPSTFGLEIDKLAQMRKETFAQEWKFVPLPHFSLYDSDFDFNCRPSTQNIYMVPLIARQEDEVTDRGEGCLDGDLIFH